jgi:zinc/manganese transport system substrate-binding protein
MRIFTRGAAALLILLACGPAQATVKILATTADWGALATELGGDRVSVYVATNAMQDVHRVDAKPSLVARARTADLVFATGAELEIGWLPVLVQESGNPRIQPGAAGYFEAAAGLNLLEVPSRLDRSLGDIHPQGNPHLQLDPHNIALIAKALTSRLAMLDAGNATYYQQRGSDFDTR